MPGLHPQLPASELQVVLKELTRMTRLDLRLKDVPGKVTPQDASKRVKELGANAVVFLTSCDHCDVTMLSAPENGWTIINAAAITKGAKDNVFAAARLRKEMMRGYFATAGSMNSQYPGSIMGFVGSPSDLDKLVEEVPMDVVMRTTDCLAKMGVTPIRYTTYKRACEAGWAPPPTNDIQKAIWEKNNSAKERGPENALHIVPPKK